MGNGSTKSGENIDPTDCRCQKIGDFKMKRCACGRSKPSYDPPKKIGYWHDAETLRNEIRYISAEKSERTKNDKDGVPEYQTFVRELEASWSNKYKIDNKKCIDDK